jgi:hypothetical protein
VGSEQWAVGRSRRQEAEAELRTKNKVQRPKTKVQSPSQKILTKYQIQDLFPFRIFIEFETNPHPNKKEGAK